MHADSVLGRFDAVVVLDGQNLEEVSEIIYKVIEKIPNVVSTETLVNLRTK